MEMGNMGINYWPWVLLAVGTGVLSAIVNSQHERHRGVRNSSVAGLVFFAVFLAIDAWILPGDWWGFSGSDTIIVLGVALVLGVFNIGLSLWAQRGSDYSEMSAQGLVNDGCFHKAGRLQIPKNLLSNGAVSLGEEMLFRGFIGILLYLWLGPWVAVAVTAVLFGLTHYVLSRNTARRQGIQPGRYVASIMLITTLTPAIFMVAVIFYHSLVPGWLLHWGINCIVGAYMRYGRKMPQVADAAGA